MPKFIPYDPKQSKMVVINYADQLQPGTFEHAINYLIEHKLDLTIFHPSFNNNDTGRPAYDPAILLKIIFFAYSKGITPTRQTTARVTDDKCRLLLNEAYTAGKINEQLDQFHRYLH